MDLVPSIVEKLSRLFYQGNASGTGDGAQGHAHAHAHDRLARFRPRQSLFRKSVEVQGIPPAFESPAVEEDATLLWQETEFFGRRPLDGAGETRQRPIGPHLWVLAVTAWLFTIDPVFRALTPRNFSGVPALQLLAVMFVMPLILFGVMWLWARLLGPRARGFIRTQVRHWKRWLCFAVAAIWVRSALG